MSKKKQSRDEEIWSKRFGEDYDNVEYVSRSERSKNSKYDNDGGMSPFLTGTVIFLAVLILATIFYYVWYSNLPSDQVGADDDGVEMVEDNEENDTPSDEADDDAVVEEDEAADTNQEIGENTGEDVEPEPEPAPEPEPEPVPEPEPEPAPAPQPEPEPAPEVAPPVDRVTYTVQPGDNMYRIALNHGLTTAELMALNNLTDETVYVGQVLIVE